MDGIVTGMKAVQLNQGNGDTKELTASATGTQGIRSNMLQKKAEGYDYTDHTIGWCITVNENKMPMKSDAGILLEDTLAEGLTYVKDSLEVTKEITNADGNVETKADVDQIAGFKENNRFNISNSVILKRAGYDELSVSANQEINNKILAKSGKYEKDQGTITYTVNLNPHGITLDNTIVRDELPEGLQIDKDTIRLYQATVDKTGVFTKDKSVDLTGLLTVNVLERWFEIKLPTGTTSYVLEYVTDVTDITQTSFSNKISLNGTVNEDAGQGGADVGLGSGGGGGGGTASSKVNLTLRKVDAMRPEVKLQGGVFRISDEDGSMNQITTDVDGKAIFRYLKRGKTYTIEEITPPTGYQKMEETITISIDDKTPKQYEYLVTNQPVTGDLSFVVKNDVERVLGDVEFTLTDQTLGSKWSTTVGSGMDGKVTFANLPYGTYILKQTKAPEYHTLDTAEYLVVVDEKGNVTITDPSDTENPGKELTEIVNEVEKTSIIVTAIEKDSQEAMEGVEFSIYDPEEKLIETKTTDKKGMVMFENLEVGGSYVIRESVPEGYAADTQTQKVTLTKDSLELTWTNYHAAHVTTKPEPADNDGNTNSAGESQTLRTGDSTPWMRFLTIAFLSGGVIVITVLYRISMKKRKESDR